MTEYSCCIARGGRRELGYPPSIDETLATVDVSPNLVGADLALALAPLIDAGKAQRDPWMIIHDDIAIPDPLKSLATELWEKPPAESVFDARLLHRSLRTLVRAVRASSACVHDRLLFGLGETASAVLKCNGLEGRYVLPNVTETCRVLTPPRGQLRLEFQEGRLALVSARSRLEVVRPTMDIPFDTGRPTLALRVPRSAVVAATSDCVRRDQRYLLEYFDNELTLAGPNGRTAIPFQVEEERAPVVARSFSGRALRRAAVTFESEELLLEVHGRWNGSGTVHLSGTTTENDVLVVTIPAASYKELRHRLRTFGTASPTSAQATGWTPPPTCESHELAHELFWTVDVSGTHIWIPATCRGCKRKTKVGLDIRKALQCGVGLDMRRVAFDFMSPSRYRAEVGPRGCMHRALSDWILLRRHGSPLVPTDLFNVVAATSSEVRDARDALSPLRGGDAVERPLIQQIASALEDWRAERDAAGLETSLFDAQVVALHDLAYWSPVSFAALLGIELHEPSTEFCDTNDRAAAGLDEMLLQYG